MSVFLFLVFVLLWISGCGQNEKSKGEAPPPPPTITLRPCEGAGKGMLLDLPQRVKGFCVDPRSDVRRYGATAPSPLGAVCVELFNGECELYKSYGLDGVKTLSYVAEAGSLSSVNVVASSFRRSSGAFGFFTRRILGGDLPSQRTVEPFEVKGRAVSGAGMSVLWRGKQVLELTYINETETPEEIVRNSRNILLEITRSLAEALPGPITPDRRVRFLESEALDTLGVAVQADGLLQVMGSGPGVFGFYSKADTPHRLLLAERRDQQGSKDLLKHLLRSGVSKKLKGRDIVRLRHTREGATPETWYLRRQGQMLLGVGPLLLMEQPTLSTPEARKLARAKWEQFAIRRLLQISKRERSFEKLTKPSMIQVNRPAE